MDAEKSGGVSRGFVASRNHADNLRLLLKRELWAGDRQRGLRDGRPPNRLGAFPLHRALKLGERSYHLHHHAPSRACGVDRLGQAAKSRLCLRQPFHRNSDRARQIANKFYAT